MKVCELSGRPAARRGVALVVVLGMLVLVLVLVVAFLSSVSTELQSAKKYSGGADARALADSAVSLVISQIQDATSTPQLAWASQPGMIRTYTGNGTMDTAYKLYSSGTMRVGGNFNPVTALSTEVPDNWTSQPGVFTDLNRPVAVAGVNRYPILDPSAVGNGPGGAALEGSSAPIEGCFIDTSNNAVKNSSGSGNPVPMPVQWLYVLNSGSIVPVDPANQSIASATQDDPIVGRIAFWTDDETSKVNINTASDSAFWDRPLADSVDGGEERRFAESLPVQNEFQRYPGHPATTSLSVVFPTFGGTGTAREILYDVIPRISRGGSQQGTVTITRNSVPIVPDNQRLFATVDEFLFSASSFSGSSRAANPQGGTGFLGVDDVERTRFFLTANSRAPEVNQFNKPRVTLWPLQANTQNISDPEMATNRSAKDRLIAFCSTVGTIPYYFQRYNTYTGPGQDPIPSSQSPIMDWDLIPRNKELYAYLQAMTSRPVPGLGGSILEKYPASRDQILTQMWDLTRSMVNTFNTAELPNYFYTPFDKSSMVTGQGQVVPLELPNGTKGFGRFPTITEAALIFYNKDPLTVSGTVPAKGFIASGTNIIKVFDENNDTVLVDYKLENNPYNRADYIITGTSHKLNVDLPGPKNIGVVLILEPFNPTPGAPPWTANVRFAVRGLDNLGIGFTDQTLLNNVVSIDSSYNATSQTGLEQYLQYPPRKPKVLGPTDLISPDPTKYPFASAFTVSGSTFNISAADIEIDIYQGSSESLDSKDLIQTIKMRFPAVTGLPIPRAGKSALVDYDKDSSKSKESTQITLINAKHETFREFNHRLNYSRNEGAPSTTRSRWGIAEEGQHSPLPIIFVSGDIGDTVRSVETRWAGNIRGDLRLIAGLKTVPDDYFEGHGTKDSVLGGALYTDTAVTARVSHSLSYDISPGNSDTSNSNGYYAGTGGANDTRGRLEMSANYTDVRRGNNSRDGTMPVAPRGLQGAFMRANGEDLPGDWDNGPGSITDGPYVNMPDQAAATAGAGSDNLYFAKGGYINSSGIVESGASYSPNRQIASAVAFGSLPAVIDQTIPANSQPWRTLLFGRQPAAGSKHPGFGQPFSGPPYSVVPDHAFLDLFTMPIVEPYAISEPFSSAGKVNMNYQIVPFTYLTRNTGVRAVMKPTRIMAISQLEGDSYKYRGKVPPPFRYTLNLDENSGTLKGFEDRFRAGDIFRAASEICTISLVPGVRSDGDLPPHDPKYDSMEDWWKNFKLTGDNAREGPYGHLYPRLTTKSNTFTVHVIAQSINKSGNTPVNQFVEGKDQITGEFRGSFLIERYLDPNADSLVKADGKTPGSETDPDSMVGPYKFRVVSTKKFAP